MQFAIARRLTREEGMACRMMGGDESWNPYGHEMPEYRGFWSSGWSEMNARIRAQLGGLQQQLRARN